MSNSRIYVGWEMVLKSSLLKIQLDFHFHSILLRVLINYFRLNIAGVFEEFLIKVLTFSQISYIIIVI